MTCAQRFELVEAAKPNAARIRWMTQIEMIWRFKKTEGQRRFPCMSEDDLQAFLRHPNTMIACEAACGLC